MNLVKDSIAHVGANSLTTGSGEEHTVDFIVRCMWEDGVIAQADQKLKVLATGFKFTQWKAEAVIGQQGKSLQQHWNVRGGIGAYKTVAINEFPNMFYLLGPNSGSGHTSVLFAMEWYVESSGNVPGVDVC